MPWTTTFLSEGAELKYSGTVSGADVLEAKRQFFSDPASASLRFVLCDFTDVEKLEVKASDVQRIIRQDLASVASHPALMEVVVAPQPYAFGLARMWEQQVDEARPLTRVVQSRAEGEAWLRAQGV